MVVLSTFLTVVSGVLVFVLGQLFNEYFLKPIQNYKEIKSKIAYNLTFYANLYMNPVENSKKNENIETASQEIRKLGAEVDAISELRPFGNIFIPKKRILKKVSKKMIGLSNNFISENQDRAIEYNENARKTIYEMLKINNQEE